MTMRERIADLAVEHALQYDDWAIADIDFYTCNCGWKAQSGTGPSEHEWAKHLADMLTTELGLSEEWGATTDKWNGGRQIRGSREEAQADLEEAIARRRYPVDDPSPIVTRQDMRIESRYVTDWQVL